MTLRGITRRAARVLAAGVLVLLAAGCGAASTRPAVAISIKATDLKFEPAQIEVTGPGPLAITLNNAGAVEHNFVIEGVPGKLTVQPGRTASYTFDVPKTGTFAYHCSIAGHTEAGMKGTLTVR